jgi:hypothetical protein
MVSRARRLSDAASSYKKGLSSSQPSAKLASAKTRLTCSGALKQQLPEYLLERGEAGEPMPAVEVTECARKARVKRKRRIRARDELAKQVLSHALGALNGDLFREVEGMWCACSDTCRNQVH